MNNSGTNEHSVTVGLPRYELIDKHGNPVILHTSDGKMLRRLTFATSGAAAEHAAILFPDQEQDPDRAGKGWDIQATS